MSTAVAPSPSLTPAHASSAARVQARRRWPASRPVVYPPLVALWLVLRMAAANAADLRGPGDLLRPVAISLAAAACSWLAALALVPRDRHRRALVALLGVLWFAFLPAIANTVVDSPLAALPATGPATSSAWLVLPLVAAVVLLRRDLAPLTRFLDATALALLLLTLPALRGLVMPHGASKAGGDSPPPLEWPLPPDLQRAASVAAAGPRPDVYLIVLDKYTGAASLRANYGFDNAPFLAALRERGFVIPAAPRANYPMTHLALSSMLNWRLLEGSPPDADANEGMDRSYARVESNRTVALFRAMGYRFHFLPSSYAVTVRNRHADAIHDAEPARWSEFEIVWRGSTALRALQRRARLVQSPRRTERRIAMLRGIADSAGPDFAFAHFLVPHEPYVFGADCSHLATPFSPEQASDLETGALEVRVKRAYVAQLQCVNRMMLALVDSIDRHSATRPVILFQADHGHGRLYTRLPLDRVPGDRVVERMDIFAAYRFPGAERLVYDSISPVNAIPAALEGTFGLVVPRAPDASYWSAWDRPFATTRLR